MLSVSNLHAGYGKVQVLHGLNLEVPRGSLVTLIGANGAGKTTTLRVLSGMIAPRSGSIHLSGIDITGWPSHAITRQGMAHSPEGRRVFPTLSVTDNLLLGGFPRLTGARARGDIDADLRRMFDLFPRLDERALMLNPDVLLLDEPSMGLAPKLVEEVFATIARLKALKVTMLLVEQFAAAALEIADTGYVLENGRITVSGSASDLRDNPKVRAAYLGGHARAS